MPDQTVKVSFTAPNTFTFDPPAAIMTASGKINFQQHPASPSWTFVSINELPSPTIHVERDWQWQWNHRE